MRNRFYQQSKNTEYVSITIVNDNTEMVSVTPSQAHAEDDETCFLFNSYYHSMLCMDAVWDFIAQKTKQLLIAALPQRTGMILSLAVGPLFSSGTSRLDPANMRDESHRLDQVAQGPSLHP